MERQNESNLLTKECIVTALLRLMQEKKYESISITDITTLAGVSRMAYYRNYKSKDEILIKYLLDQKDRLVSDIGNRRADDLKEIIKYGAMFYQDNAAVIQAVYEAGLAHHLSGILEECIYDYFPVVSTTTDGRYAVHFYVGAVFSVFRLWFDEGMLESADEISELIYRFINNDTTMDFLVVPGEDK